MRRCAGSLLVAACVVAGCARAGDRAGTTTTSRPQASSTTVADDADGGTPSTTAAAGPPKVSLERVITLDAPTALAARPGSDLLYAAEKAGKVWALRPSDGHLTKVGPGPVLDIVDQVESSGSEQGLLGIAFSPDGGQLVVDYIERGGDAGTTRVVRYDVAADGTVRTDSRHEVFSVAQPFTNHNGGNVVYGPDGALYVGLGDGGSQGDPKHHGQDPRTPFAKILRFDPATGARENWVIGLRNPWRFSFDPTNGDLWIGDVGANDREEVDHLPGGGPDRPGGGPAEHPPNLGWSLREGRKDTDKPGDRTGLVDPVFDESHDHGVCSIIGGGVYRGATIPSLAGRYVFGDFCRAGLRWLDPAHPSTSHALGVDVGQLSSFGVDGSGEIYALSLDGSVERLRTAA